MLAKIGWRHIRSSGYTMKLHIAIPAMQERETLPATLDCIAQQYKAGDFCVYICVNQPDAWWYDEQKQSVCVDNQKTLAWLKQETRFPLEILDVSSPGKGMIAKKSGVGYARKMLIDYILQKSEVEDLVISMDADTVFREGYFQAVRSQFGRYPNHVAMATPYYHRLTGNEKIDRSILRYETYMRFYALNLTRIGSPYNFTALGSAIVAPVWALKAVRGIAPYTSGEDFYLLQKLRKFGKIILWCPEMVYPSARVSNRVAFGTGPAMAKKMGELQQNYPFYPPELFDKIGETYRLFSTLWKEDTATPMDDFLHQQLGKNLWQPLRKNFKTEQQFIRACHEKIDGLRILQFLKYSLKERDDGLNFVKNWHCFFNEKVDGVDFEHDDIERLQNIRNVLKELSDKIFRDNAVK